MTSDTPNTSTQAASTSPVSSQSGNVDIRLLHDLDEMHALLAVADAVWGIAPGGLVGPDFLVALTHAGGYVSGAFDGDRMIGASFGVLARHRGDWCLHSHITGVVPDQQNSGLGRRLKRHQYDWARRHGLAAITWTFDPLVRRNAWFNLHVLGAIGTEYHENFYGPLRDDINGDDDSDRLLARWDIDSPRSRSASSAPLPAIEPRPGDHLVPTPADIGQPRRSDDDAARHWRRALRADLQSLLDDHDVIGLTADGAYVARIRTDNS